MQLFFLKNERNSVTVVAQKGRTASDNRLPENCRSAFGLKQQLLVNTVNQVGAIISENNLLCELTQYETDLMKKENEDLHNRSFVSPVRGHSWMGSVVLAGGRYCCAVTLHII